ARSIVHGWLLPRLPGAKDLQLSEIEMPSGAGVANETLMFDATWTDDQGPQKRSFVLRADSPDPLFLESPAELHYRIYKLLGEESDVPVPPVLDFESDTSLLGVPFFLMGKIEGRVPGDQPPFNVEGWVVDLPPTDRRALWTNFVGVMAQLHQVDSAKFDLLQRPELGKSGLEQHVRHWFRYYDLNKGTTDYPIVDAARQWLIDNLPDDAPTAFSWGDARLQNVIFQGTDVAAVLDWDMVSLAGPEADVAWYCVLEHGQTKGLGIPSLDGLGSRRETLELWEQLMGRKAQHFEYQLMFAAFRLATVMIRLPNLLRASGLEAAADHLAATQTGIPYLAQMLGLPYEKSKDYPWTGLD
ncbi:MAG: putative adenine phosphoribosyltransferase, partial [Acidimicrobiia bacterium]|nr:putative adenine phosphoribosyltransferase [Acidimicrobiia bacterium]